MKLKICSSIDLNDVLFHAVGFVHHGTLVDCDNDEFKKIYRRYYLLFYLMVIILFQKC